jgi:hypothetical protein
LDLGLKDCVWLLAADCTEGIAYLTMVLIVAYSLYTKVSLRWLYASKTREAESERTVIVNHDDASGGNMLSSSRFDMPWIVL